jgi:hypothetical protein
MKIMRPYILVPALILTFPLLILNANAQPGIPIGQWRSHVSFNSIRSITTGSSKTFAAASSGLMILDHQDMSVSGITSMNGLAGAIIRFIRFDQPSQQLFLAYDDGTIDIIRENEIEHFNWLNDTPVSGPVSIHHITFHQGLAYLSAAYGVVVFDITKRQVKETWRNLGAVGSQLAIYQSALLGDSIFLATGNGVLAGRLNDNLLDFSKWKRYDEAEMNGPVKAVSVFEGILYAAIDNAGVFHLENGNWILEDFLQNGVFQSLNSSDDHLVICQSDHVWQMAGGTLSEVISPLLTESQFALEDDQGTVWIGDNENGLLSVSGGTTNQYIANGPAFNVPFRLSFSEGKLFALEGGYANDFSALGRPGKVSIFSAGKWDSANSPLNDLTDLTAAGGVTYLSSYGYGVQSGPPGAPDVVYNETNSTLVNANPPGNFVNVTALAAAGNGIWVANYNASSSLHWFADGSWQAYSFPFTAARYPLSLAVDYTGSVWGALSPAAGGGILVFNRNENKSAYLTDLSGSGGLPHRNVHCLVSDRDGSMWIGTDNGVAYFVNPAAVYGTEVSAVRPIFENRFLLNGERITTIAIDGGNRKWVGTERGVWLFGPNGDKLLHNFTSGNSPLPSGVIRDIALDPASGEVFFATGAGLVSFRADATESDGNFTSVRIFPNPVTEEFNGLVGISGLATDAVVKITDASGKLIWQTYANGGTASWNVRDYNGRRASSGMYLVFCATADGGQQFVGKIAVIE